MKIRSNYLKSEKISEHFLDVGVSEHARHFENIDLIKTSPQKVDFFKIEKMFSNLRKSLTLTTNIIAKRGHVTVYGPSLSISSNTKHFKQNEWVHGLISNFKTTRKIGGKFPSFIVVMTNNTSEQQSIENESLRAQVPSLFISNSNNARIGLFNIPGNNISKKSTTFVADLFLSAISAGHLKEVAIFNLDKKFPRLDSNQ